MTWTQQQPQGQTITNKYGTFTQPPDPDAYGKWTQTTKLGAAEQRQKDQRDAVYGRLGDVAQHLSWQIPTGKFNLNGLSDAGVYDGSFSENAKRVEDATYQRLQNLMADSFDTRERQLDNRLAVMGLPVGGEAYGTEKDRSSRLRNEADLNAALEAVGAGRQEAMSQFNAANTLRSMGINERLLERSQPFNELAAIMQGSPAINTPQAPNTAQYQVAPPDISGLIQNQYNTNAANQASKKGGVTDLAGTLGAAALMAPVGTFSDNHLKDNITFIANINGHNIYKWNWNDKAEDLGLTGSGSGVIAQEVEMYAPHAVIDRDGYKAVNYGTLFEAV